jgi:hypothetical protein
VPLRPLPDENEREERNNGQCGRHDQAKSMANTLFGFDGPELHLGWRRRGGLFLGLFGSP